MVHSLLFSGDGFHSIHKTSAAPQKSLLYDTRNWEKKQFILSKITKATPRQKSAADFQRPQAQEQMSPQM
ncbi:MAG: hypothetical protein KIC79_09330 [Firmicutes bacterium]|nr:hypothetical protein [Bacillota bacterium]